MKVKFAEGGKLEQKTLGVRLRSTNLSPRAEPRTRSRVMEVGSATDDHYANLTPLLLKNLRKFFVIGKLFPVQSIPRKAILHYKKTESKNVPEV